MIAIFHAKRLVSSPVRGESDLSASACSVDYEVDVALLLQRVNPAHENRLFKNR
jgi:hypothetical protein